MKSGTGRSRGYSSARLRDDVVLELEELISVISENMEGVHFRKVLKQTLVEIMSHDPSLRAMVQKVCMKFLANVLPDFGDIVRSKEIRPDPSTAAFWHERLRESPLNHEQSGHTSEPCHGTPLDYFCK